MRQLIVRRFRRARECFCLRKRYVETQERGGNGASQSSVGGGGESFVCQCTEFSKRTKISGRCIFSPLSSHFSLFHPSTYPKGCYF